MNHPSINARLLAAAFALNMVLAGCGVVPQEPSARRPDKQKMAHFEQVAEASCKCTRGKGSEASCWKAFDEEVKPYKPSEFYMACGPSSAVTLCFGPDGSVDNSDCIGITRQGAMGCNAKEFELADAIHAKASRGAKTDKQRAQANERADAEIARAFATMDQGGDVSQPKLAKGGKAPSFGC